MTKYTVFIDHKNYDDGGNFIYHVYADSPAIAELRAKERLTEDPESLGGFIINAVFEGWLTDLKTTGKPWHINGHIDA